MHSNQVYVFDIWGEYGHFRKFNTTTSPLTYGIPTRTALIGIIGAILGIERESNIGKYAVGQTPLAEIFAFDKVNIAVQVLNPVNKVMMAFNLLNTKTSFFNIENRTQIEFELLKNPKYRIFIDCKDEKITKELAGRIENKEIHFTVSLGLSQFIANIQAIGFFDAQPLKNSEYVSVISALKMSLLDKKNPIKAEKEFRYLSDTLPVWMTSDRLVKEYAEVLIEGNAKPILAKSEHFINVEFCGNILFL